MRKCRSHGVLRALLVGGLLYGVDLLASVSHADVTSGGLGTVVNQPSAGLFDITGGTRPNHGANLFHSFGNFSLDEAESASFVNDSGLATTNILGRVTGGNTSNIFGTIDTSAFPGANLFLMNPAGILFGPTAQLNVDGSFHATTADYIGLADGTRFNAASSSADALLTVAAPSAFGFLSANPAPIDVNTSAPTGVLFQVPFGQTMSFVGGTINIGAADGSAAGYVMAPAGTLNVVSVASPGEATFNSPINVDAFAELGEINIRGNSMIDGRDVFIRAGQLTMGAATDPADPSSPVLPGIISPGVFSLFGLGPEANGGEVNVDVTGDVIVAGDGPEPLLDNPGGIISFAGFSDPTAKVPDVTINAGGTVLLSGFSGIELQRFGSGAPAQVTVNADTVKLEKGAAIALLNFYEGPGGNIAITAQDELDIAGDGSVGHAGSATGLLAQGLFHPSADFFGDPAFTYADSGSIAVNAGTLRISGDGIITTTSVALGSSSDINIDAHDIFLSDRPAHINANSFFAGPSGNININASGRIEITDGFVIFADTNGTGASGDVKITAAGPINISGEASGLATQTTAPSPEFLDFFAQSVFGYPDYAALVAGFEPFGLPTDADMFQLLTFLDEFGFTSLREPLQPASGGAISVTAPILTVDGRNSAIDSGSGWDGNAGNVLVDVDALTVSGGAAIRSRSGLVDLTTNGPLLGGGDAGGVTLNVTDSVSVRGLNSSISTSTFGDGNGGNINLTADQVLVTDGGSITAETGGILGDVFLSGTGSAGKIAITTASTVDAITVSGEGSAISTATYGDGAGGAIELNANRIAVLAGGAVTAQTGGTLEGGLFAGTGAGGSVTVNAADIVSVSGSGSTVSATTSGAGQGGDIELTGDQVEVVGGGSVTAEASGAGSAGTIDLAATDLLTVSGTDSTVSTTTVGDGDGGSIALRGNKVEILDGGGVTADSFGTGLTGNIAVTADESIVMDGGTISTRAVTSDGGNIQLTATDRVYMDDAEITTSVESGFGGGGNINIDPDFVIMRNGRILANAYGGPGGNIDIVAGNFIATPDSLVDASSALGIDGTVNISSPDQDVSQDLAVLPAKYLDVTSLISDRCGTTAGASSLVDAGPGGLAVNPDGYLPSFVTEANPAEDGKGGGRSVGSGPRWWAPYVHQSALDVAGITCDPDLSLQEDDRRHGSPGRGRTGGISP